MREAFGTIKPMPRPLIGSFVILLGFVGVLTLRYIQTKQNPVFVSQLSSITLQPPAQAITAALSQSTGVVEQFTREADAYQEATPGGTVRQGESVATKQGTATVTMGTRATVLLHGNAEVSFVSLIPDSFMLLQKAGVVDYEVNTVSPVSIRAQHALVELAGDATISVDDPIIKIEVVKGTAKLALVDTENNTTIWNMTEGQLARINDKTRVVELRN